MSLGASISVSGVRFLGGLPTVECALQVQPSELKRTSAWHVVARNRDGWIATGPTEWCSRSIITKPPGHGRGQSGAEVKLASGQTFDDQRDAGTGWTAESGWRGAIDACCRAEHCAAAFKCRASPAVGEKSEVPDAHQAEHASCSQHRDRRVPPRCDTRGAALAEGCRRLDACARSGPSYQSHPRWWGQAGFREQSERHRAGLSAD